MIAEKRVAEEVFAVWCNLQCFKGSWQLQKFNDITKKPSCCWIFPKNFKQRRIRRILWDLCLVEFRGKGEKFDNIDDRAASRQQQQDEGQQTGEGKQKSKKKKGKKFYYYYYFEWMLLTRYYQFDNRLDTNGAERFLTLINHRGSHWKGTQIFMLVL